MEFMAVSSTPYDTDRFGAALPRFSPRQSDLLMVVGTVTHKQAPILLKVYEQMCEPKWVMAFGACATSGGFYQNYAALPGIDKIIPVDIYIPGLPAAPRDGDRRDHAAAGQDRGRRSTRSSPRISEAQTWAPRFSTGSSTRLAAREEEDSSRGRLVPRPRRARHPGREPRARRGRPTRCARSSRVRLRHLPRRDGGRLAGPGPALRGGVALLLHRSTRCACG